MEFDLSAFGIPVAEPEPASGRRVALPADAMGTLRWLAAEVRRLNARMAVLERSVSTLDANDRRITDHVNGLDATVSKTAKITAALIQAAQARQPRRLPARVVPQATEQAPQAEPVAPTVEAEVVDPQDASSSGGEVVEKIEDVISFEDAAFYGMLPDED